ncbi:cholesterol 24-hydroxylase-like [Asterias rubens]|uniref:cholesterol 24-hydroxylase-like n=1 Tax=Asterias rubens TaxID=7604 RepID=UPI001455687F|nr:cholesterol 24-hydroxylase-like [Asterias rubens]
MATLLGILTGITVGSLAITLCAFIALVIYIAYQHKRYAHIPGPPRNDFFTGNLRQVTGSESLPEFLAEQMRTYGPVFLLFMLQKPVVIVLEPNFIKEVLHSTTHFKPPVEHANFWHVYGERCFYHGLLTETNVPKHLKRRSLFNPAFHRKYLMQSMDVFNDSVELLINELSSVADGKTEVKMLDLFNRITLDAVAKVAFGLELGDVMDHDSPFTKAIGTTLKGVQAQFYTPWKRFSPFTSDRKFREEVRESIRFVRETGRRCIEDRIAAKRRGDKIPKDLLTYILDVSGDFNADKDFQIEDMLDEFFTFFFAGQETSANLMAFMLVELGHSPEIYQRVMTEVNAVFGSNDRIEYKDLAKLEYLTMVIKETLRLWPPAFGTNRELATDMTVLGMKIPAGTVIWFNTYVMARMEKYYIEPLVFDPERFNKVENERDRNLYTYFPFSMGTRACIGQSFAMIEVRLIIGRLLHNFNFTLVPGQDRDDIMQEITIKPRGRCRNYLTKTR